MFDRQSLADGRRDCWQRGYVPAWMAVKRRHLAPGTSTATHPFLSSFPLVVWGRPCLASCRHLACHLGSVGVTCIGACQLNPGWLGVLGFLAGVMAADCTYQGSTMINNFHVINILHREFIPQERTKSWKHPVLWKYLLFCKKIQFSGIIYYFAKKKKMA